VAHAAGPGRASRWAYARMVAFPVTERLLLPQGLRPRRSRQEGPELCVWRNPRANFEGFRRFLGGKSRKYLIIKHCLLYIMRIINMLALTL